MKPNTVKSEQATFLSVSSSLCLLFLLSGMRQCQPSPGSVSEREGETFSQTCQFGQRAKGHSAIFGPSRTESTQNAANSECICKPRPPMMSVHPEETQFLSQCFAATFIVLTLRDRVVCFLGLWPLCVCVCGDRTSCAAVVTSLLQRYACFDLTGHVFEELIPLFCSR